ncbi:MAG: hypothetical protein WC861_04630 [Candidatus Micrarchaeia archaeon]
MKFFTNAKPLSFQATNANVKAFSAKITDKLMKPFLARKEARRRAEEAQRKAEYEKTLMHALQVSFVRWKIMEPLVETDIEHVRPWVLDRIGTELRRWDAAHPQPKIKVLRD